jgi:hypothetical protein
MIDLASVAAKLAELRARDGGFKVFGAISHRYLLNPRLDERALTTFERTHAINLPDEYRAFVNRLGNGGAGPFYGIFACGEMDHNHECAPWSEQDGFVGELRAAFPHQLAWNLPSDELELPDSFESDEAEEQWHDELDRRCWDTALVNGAIPICHHGCALRTWLVVSGAERGNVWYDARAEGGGLQPHRAADGRHLTFGAWYEDWLDRSLEQLARR